MYVYVRANIIISPHHWVHSVQVWFICGVKFEPTLKVNVTKMYGTGRVFWALIYWNYWAAFLHFKNTKMFTSSDKVCRIFSTRSWCWDQQERKRSLFREISNDLSEFYRFISPNCSSHIKLKANLQSRLRW